MIDNPRSPRVRAVAKLAKRDGRRESGLFLLEGPQAVGEALAYRADLLEAIYATKAAIERHGDLVRDAKAAQVDIVAVTDKVLEAMADTVTPQGVVAVARGGGNAGLLLRRVILNLDIGEAHQNQDFLDRIWI